VSEVHRTVDQGETYAAASVNPRRVSSAAGDLFREPRPQQWGAEIADRMQLQRNVGFVSLTPPLEKTLTCHDHVHHEVSLS
jgi:hypothetical protein